MLNEWRRLAFSDLRDVADWDESGVRVIPKAEPTDDAARSLDEIVEHRTRRITTRRTKDGGEVETVTEERQVRVKLHDKIAALTALSKFLGILEKGEAAETRPLFPPGFFAAIVMGDVSKIKGYVPELALEEDAAIPATAERVDEAPDA